MNNIEITPIKSFKDNYIWFISIDDINICIDPGDFKPVIEFLDKNNYILNQIWITHGHFDHVGGVKDLKKNYSNCKVIGSKYIEFVDIIVEDGFTFKLGNFLIKVWSSPGHTKDHIVFLLQDINNNIIRIFTGDTLFSAGAGRVFSGTIFELKNSIDKINNLPEDTIIYPAHEYTKENLEFALFLENNNKDIINTLQTLKIPSLPVVLRNERKINPFLRYKNIQIINFLKKNYPEKIENEDYLSIFKAIRELKNNFIPK